MVKRVTPSTLTCTVVAWRLTATTSMSVPGWKGSMLRGACGWALRRVASGAPAPPWPGLAAGADFTAAIGDPQVAWQSPVATGPFTLQCPDARSHLQAGDDVHGRYVLFGPWPEWAISLLEEVLRDGAAHGLGASRQAFTLAEWSVESLAWPTPPPEATALRLTTLTPCRLMDRQEECTTLQAPAIARSILRRWRQLHRQLVGSDLPVDYQALAAAADLLTSDHGNDAEQAGTIRRWSNRQSRHIEMTGISGTVIIAGESLPMLAPILALAPLLHIGKQPVFGLGQVDLAWLSDAQPASRTPSRPQQADCP